MHVVRSRAEAVSILCHPHSPDDFISDCEYAETRRQAAHIAWRAASLISKQTHGRVLNTALIHLHNLVLNDDPAISQIINTYGYGHYNRR